MNTDLHDLFEHNRAWAAQMERERPGFFTGLKAQQRPRYMWIGCSDSRVPANQITGLEPGEVFVHRNVANVVVPTDLNCLSTIQYAVDQLKVEHLMVVGHYGCGGVQAAMTQQSLGLINKWLRNIKDVYRLHKAEVDAQPTEQARLDRMVELNVQEQVFDLMKTSIIQAAWKNRGGPHLHGWVYRLSDGRVKSICDVPAGSPIDDIYRFENLG